MGDLVELPVGETLVGRDVTCALRFNDAAVSRRHLRFVRRHDEVFVEDLNSSNGTMLNGRVVAAPLPIEDGDEIRVGARLLRVRITDEDAEQPSTLVLRSFNAGAEVAYARPTMEIPVVAAPLPAPHHQRCPKCAASVSELDDQCAACGYHWGTFRPMTRTDVRPNPMPAEPPPPVDREPPRPIDRRRHDRHPVELHLVYASDELEIEAISRDLSESGVFVCSQVLDPVGTRCQLTILVDGGPAVVCEGIVRRVVEHASPADAIGLGVEFVGLGDAQLAWIRATVERVQEMSEDEHTKPIELPLP